MSQWTPGLQTPVRAAIAYGVFGFLWIGTTDHLVERMFIDSAIITQAQTVKGWVFVSLSALIVYALISHNHRRLERKNSQLDDALRQISVLHRVLRHNLRNSCNVIRGHAQLIESDGTNGVRESAGVIRKYSDQLVELSDRTRRLRNIVTADPDSITTVDLLELIDSQVTQTRQKYSQATIVVETPDSLHVQVCHRLSTVLEELIDNAVTHNESEQPMVQITVEWADLNEVAIIVSDNGPGIPPVERNVLEMNRETPMSHSQGIGLLMVQTIINQADGTLEVHEDESPGTTVQATIPTSRQRIAVESQLYPGHV